MGEHFLLTRLQQMLQRPFGRGAGCGIGDDAALVPVPPRQDARFAALCCDAVVEDVDFCRRWASFADVGHKAAAINLSDLAAMGARPQGLLLALALRPQERVVDILQLVRRCDAVGKRFGAPLVGGDLSRTTGPLVAVVTALGHCSDGGRRRGVPLRRHRARPGDVVLVGGSLGAARAGLALLQGEATLSAALRRTARIRALVRRQLRPEPQLALGQALAREAHVHAAVDLSDGLWRDALHLVPRGCGVTIDVCCLPVAPGVAEVAAAVRGKRQPRRARKDALPLPQQWALAGGEDFVLALAAAPAAVAVLCAKAHKVGARLVAVGRVTRQPGIRLVNGEGAGMQSGAFDHFR